MLYDNTKELFSNFLQEFLLMRLRNIPGADEIVASSPYCINQPAIKRGQWRSFLRSNSPIHIEIGMGKGKFLMKIAALHPEIQYIGVERYTSVLLRAVQKMDELQLPNVHFICEDAANLPEIFAPSEVDLIYLNFSDPWPKDRHAKRRLTSHQFLERYDQFLSPTGRLEFKTDNQDLFTFSLAEIEQSDIWHIDSSTKDLYHNIVMNEGNIMTEYEEKFAALGNPICKLVASKHSSSKKRK